MAGYWQRRSLEKMQEIETEMARQTMADVRERNKTHWRRLAILSILLTAAVVVTAQQIVTGNIDLLGEQLPFDVEVTSAGVDADGQVKIVMEMGQSDSHIIFDDVFAEIREVDADQVAAAAVMPVYRKRAKTLLLVETDRFSLKDGSCNLTIRFKGVFKSTPAIPIRHLDKL